MSIQSLSFKKSIQAPVSEVFRAFTNATALREWLCDVATISPYENGRLYLAWNNGYFACGEYSSVKQAEEVTFTWCGKNDPARTQVIVSMVSVGGKTQLELIHSGIGSDSEWIKTKEELLRIWETGLGNLVSILETGEDLRITLRPMMGITISEFNDEVARKLGVPVTQGVRLDDVLDGMGAKDAGLITDDVIVAIADKEVKDWASLADALQHQQSGDRVEVGFFRGSKKMTTTMELSSRPMPEIPADQKGLAEIVSEKFREIESQLEDIFADVTESEASYKPGPEDWSVKENLAHLIHGERFTQNWIYQLLGGHEQFADDWGGNPYASVAATVAVYPTLLDLQEEYKRGMAETVSLLEHLPEDFIARKGSYWRVAYSFLEDSTHFNSHVEQIRKLIIEARKAVTTS